MRSISTSSDTVRPFFRAHGQPSQWLFSLLSSKQSHHPRCVISPAFSALHSSLCTRQSPTFSLLSPPPLHTARHTGIWLPRWWLAGVPPLPPPASLRLAAAAAAGPRPLAAGSRTFHPGRASASWRPRRRTGPSSAGGPRATRSAVWRPFCSRHLWRPHPPRTRRRPAPGRLKVWTRRSKTCAAGTTKRARTTRWRGWARPSKTTSFSSLAAVCFSVWYAPPSRAVQFPPKLRCVIRLSLEPVAGERTARWDPTRAWRALGLLRGGGRGAGGAGGAGAGRSAGAPTCSPRPAPDDDAGSQEGSKAGGGSGTDDGSAGTSTDEGSDSEPVKSPGDRAAAAIEKASPPKKGTKRSTASAAVRNYFEFRLTTERAAADAVSRRHDVGGERGGEGEPGGLSAGGGSSAGGPSDADVRMAAINLMNAYAERSRRA